MGFFGDAIKAADFKSEKHAPAIEAPDSFVPGAATTIGASVGKDIRHPNTTEHHIAWLELWFKPAGAGALINLGRATFSAHGDAVAGPNMGPAFTEPTFSTVVQLKSSGTIIACAYCNIHGLWESRKEITLGA